VNYFIVFAILALLVIAVFYGYKSINGDLTKLPFIGGGEWTIGIYTGNKPWEMSDPVNIHNPVLTQHDITDMPARGVADPFMIFKDSLWYMFFEIIHAKTNKGKIGCAISKNGYNWEYKQVVLDEPFHLSYPYVFLWEGTYYMIPESSERGMVVLYRSVSFPFQWERVTTLLNKGYVDSSFLFYNNTYWLFVSNQGNNCLRLFYSDSLTGKWTEHPQSPIISNDAGTARPGGRIINFEDKLIRFAQDCRKDYGYALRAFEITSLNFTNFEEKELTETPVVKASGHGWNANCMHHLDPYLIDHNLWIACTDGYKRKVQIGIKY